MHSSLLHPVHLVKVAKYSRGRRGQNSEKNGYVVCVWPLMHYVKFVKQNICNCFSKMKYNAFGDSMGVFKKKSKGNQMKPLVTSVSTNAK